PAAAVHALVGRLPVAERDDVLVGFGTADDAGVVRVRDDLAIVQTVDFFTPIVDDPYDFGRIAATNALSDVWAMGGEPLSALSLVAWPLERLGAEMLEEVLRGGHDAVTAAGAVIVGGHSIDDAEPKYGLAVTGLVHPDEVLTNAGGRPGDRLVLTKPLGAGAGATAAKRGLASADLVARVARVRGAWAAGTPARPPPSRRGRCPGSRRSPRCAAACPAPRPAASGRSARCRRSAAAAGWR